MRLSPGATNRVEMVYVNSQQPVHGKVSETWPKSSQCFNDLAEILLGSNVNRDHWSRGTRREVEEGQVC